MTFAKLAADELMSDPAEAERQEKHRKWMRILGTVGALGAGGAGAYYLGKHLNDNGPGTTGGWLQHLLSKAGLGVESRAPSLATGTAGGVMGWMAPGYTEGRTAKNLMENAARKDSPVAKNFDALNEEKGVQGGTGARNFFSDMQRPIAPGADVKTTPLAAQYAALGAGTGAAPVDVSGKSAFNPAKYTGMLKNHFSMGSTNVQPLASDSRTALKRIVAGMGTVAGAPAGHSWTLPNGQTLNRDDLAAGIQHMTNRGPGAFKNVIEANAGESRFGSPFHASGARIASGLAGLAAGYEAGQPLNPGSDQ